MTAITVLLVLSILLQVSVSRSVPTHPRIRGVAAAVALAIPTPTLTSDFKKNNVSAQWAEGHPKQWGTEDAKHEFPVPPDYQYFAGAVSEDERFLVMVNATSAKVVRLDTGDTVSTTTFIYNGSTHADRVRLITAPEGQYDFLVSTSDFYQTDRTYQIRFSKDGVAIGKPIEYMGRFTSFDAWPFSADRRRMLTATHVRNGSGNGLGIAYVYDLDNPASKLTLSGHTDWIMSEAFSPDGKYISTAAWDGSAKLWNATSGELIHTFGPTGGQNWLTKFSPDGKHILVSIGPAAKPSINIWRLSNLTAEPISYGNYKHWIRAIEWSPDGKYLAAGDYGQILVRKFPEGDIVQTWQMEDRRDWEVYDLTWLEGSKRLAYQMMGGLEMYDFETNLKYRWGPGDMDHFSGAGLGATYVLKNKGWVGGVSSDQKVRFWKYPD